MQKSKMGVYFPAHGFNFDLQFFVFGDFVAEEAGGDAGFALQGLKGQTNRRTVNCIGLQMFNYLVDYIGDIRYITLHDRTVI